MKLMRQTNLDRSGHLQWCIWLNTAYLYSERIDNWKKKITAISFHWKIMEIKMKKNSKQITMVAIEKLKKKKYSASKRWFIHFVARIYWRRRKKFSWKIVKVFLFCWTNKNKIVKEKGWRFMIHIYGFKEHVHWI